MEAKKKTVRKPQKENKTERGFWSAFDEPLWGPTRTRQLLKEMFTFACDSEVLSIEGLQVHFSINRSTWKLLMEKYDWFQEGVEHLRRVLFEKRLDLVAYQDKAPALLKDLFRYSSDFCDDDFNHQDRFKRADHERKRELAKELATYQAELKQGGTTNQWLDIGSFKVIVTDETHQEIV